MPAIRTQDRQNRPRQDPVSCQLCRQKKLKCDRQRPCSNCQSRKVACEFKGERPLSVDGTTIADEDDIRAENKLMKARLQRLEQAVFGHGDTYQPPRNPSITSPVYQNHASSKTTTPRAQTEAEVLDEDSAWLETMGARVDTVLPEFTERVIISPQSVDQALSSDHSTSQRRTIIVPTYDVALAFLDAYAEHLDAMQHIMHIDSARSCIEHTYRKIKSGHEVDPGALTLILGICASVGFYWTVGSSSGQSLFSDQQKALKASKVWAKQSLYATEQMRLSTITSTLEGVQGCIILMFIYYHMEGLTSRVRLMLATAITVARDLGLHRTDAPGSSLPTATQADLIDIEVRRKCWWHLTCTDWFMSFIGGPQEGMYSISPSHMSVKLPRNLNPEDLNTKGAEFSRGLEEPTVMSYYHQRIKLGMTCREVADALWSSFHILEPETIDYTIVATLDAKFERQLNELPRFLRLDIPTQQLHREYGHMYTPQISMQSVMANLMINTRRCKLHLPFLVRAKQNPRFEFSHMMGLQSARAVFEARRRVMEDEPTFTGARALRLGGILQHIFYATAVLVMNLCVNRQDDQAQIEEVKYALKVMEDSRHTSQMGNRFYDSLMAVLRKHHVKLTSNESAMQTDGGSNQPINGNGGYEPASSMPVMQDLNGEFEFDGMWQDLLDSGPMLNPREWDALLSDLDMRVG
ncbi:putative transcription factor lepB [Pseudocercospora fuligena]|uniref:Putative transcription factor lepB n=1 Tax=Pseudocercospora fuligena TaxID=685502 RepID=A0A8H6RN32_9PEZI|nr:putative transcription factor lepB [Pseudocercospora fuligena]